MEGVVVGEWKSASCSANIYSLEETPTDKGGKNILLQLHTLQKYPFLMPSKAKVKLFRHTYHGTAADDMNNL